MCCMPFCKSYGSFIPFWEYEINGVGNQWGGNQWGQSRLISRRCGQLLKGGGRESDEYQKQRINRD